LAAEPAQPDYSGQLEIFDPKDFVWPVHLIGVGGIGSALAFPLLKLGIHELHVWDKDVVEAHNLPSQLVYRPSDVGTPKVEAVKAFAERQEADCQVVAHNAVVTAETKLEGIVISGVDSMASRHDIWKAVKWNEEVPLYLDGRLGGEMLQLLTLNPSDFDAIEQYESWWLFSDKEIMPLPCAARTVIHPPTVLAGLIVANLTLFVRDLPFVVNTMASLKQLQFQTSFTTT
jgi:molybdopterin/thiamine biosynthesis adenylyltransferase